MLLLTFKQLFDKIVLLKWFSLDNYCVSLEIIITSFLRAFNRIKQGPGIYPYVFTQSNLETQIL